MWKRIGLMLVACGVMFSVAGAADAGTVVVRHTNRTTVHRTVVRPHKKVVRHHTYRTIQHRNNNWHRMW
ncbi:MAG: hypothetical protein V4719_29360 [Planctomycetota bacterium]